MGAGDAGKIGCMEAKDDVRQQIRDRALRHMCEVIETTPTEREPFVHFIVRGMLPDDIYRELLGLLPADSLYERFDAGPAGWSKPGKALRDRLTGPHWSGDRWRFKLTNESIDRLHGSQRSFWLGIRDALGSRELKETVFGRLRDGLARRFGSERAPTQLPGYPLPELFREQPGYEIKPHPDSEAKVVTLQIALARDDSQEMLGTEFYRRSTNPLRRPRELRGFELARRVPFLPNVAYAFAVTPDSWHGRTSLRGGVRERDSILHFWYAEPERANPAILAQ
jgi:hypothetical protein